MKKLFIISIVFLLLFSFFAYSFLSGMNTSLSVAKNPLKSKVPKSIALSLRSISDNGMNDSTFVRNVANFSCYVCLHQNQDEVTSIDYFIDESNNLFARIHTDTIQWVLVKNPETVIDEPSDKKFIYDDKILGFTIHESQGLTNYFDYEIATLLAQKLGIDLTYQGVRVSHKDALLLVEEFECTTNLEPGDSISLASMKLFRAK